jgi:hypothetical protein
MRQFCKRHRDFAKRHGNFFAWGKKRSAAQEPPRGSVFTGTQKSIFCFPRDFRVILWFYLNRGKRGLAGSMKRRN